METACTAGILACCAAIAGIALAAFGPDPWPKKLFIPEAVVAQDLEGRACDGTPTRCPQIDRIRLARRLQGLDDPAD